MLDLTFAIEDPEDMPMCPLCDQPIEYDAVLVQAHGVVGIAHGMCINEEMDDDDD